MQTPRVCKIRSRLTPSWQARLWPERKVSK